MNSRQIEYSPNLSDVDVSIRFESPSYVLYATNLDSALKDDANFQHEDTLHSLVQSSFPGNQVLNLQEKSIRSICQQHKSSSESFQRLNFEVKNYTYESQIMKPGSSQGITTSIVSNNVVSQKPTLRNKTRIRWTQDLHKKFIDCVNRLGGAKKATPKGILKLMNCDGLTIFHVKSHLQKYRVSHHISEYTEGTTGYAYLQTSDNDLQPPYLERVYGFVYFYNAGKGEKLICTDSTPQLDAEKGMQIVEALRVQIDVQRRLYEQLEIQRNLQMRIEEQAKQLKTMFECQVKITACKDSF
ncbi:myb-like HTH transcriptional regulator family protein [Abeliophyllum distichum]|uniref:Myb-like HTH transcriptional regulator family protein n=1 Tax=Abeliophyllum distichum TaxID=126358 RepID=A0ABD1PCA4_9LAMI